MKYTYVFTWITSCITVVRDTNITNTILDTDHPLTGAELQDLMDEQARMGFALLWHKLVET